MRAMFLFLFEINQIINRNNIHNKHRDTKSPTLLSETLAGRRSSGFCGGNKKREINFILCAYMTNIRELQFLHRKSINCLR